MIARIWHGEVPAEKSEEYLRLMRTIAVPDYKSVPGNRGAYVLCERGRETTHFITLTFWESREAIAKFAGDDLEAAKYYDFDRNFLIALEPRVRHYEVYER
jgi:heme-degrading monooxygenase HmoA